MSWWILLAVWFALGWVDFRPMGLDSPRRPPCASLPPCSSRCPGSPDAFLGRDFVLEADKGDSVSDTIKKLHGPMNFALRGHLEEEARGLREAPAEPQPPQRRQCSPSREQGTAVHRRAGQPRQVESGRTARPFEVSLKDEAPTFSLAFARTRWCGPGASASPPTARRCRSK